MLSLENELPNCKSLKMKNNTSNNFSYCSHGAGVGGRHKHKTPKCSEPPNVQNPQMFRGLALKMEQSQKCLLPFYWGGGGVCVQWQIRTHYTKSTELYYINGRYMRKLPVWNHTFMSTDINFSHPYCIVRFCLHHVKNHTNSLWSQDPYFLFPVSFLQISHGPEAINVNHTLFH